MQFERKQVLASIFECALAASAPLLQARPCCKRALAATNAIAKAERLESLQFQRSFFSSCVSVPINAESERTFLSME
eukprot:5130780-Pleurochrysis_carterae.AAC.1